MNDLPNELDQFNEEELKALLALFDTPEWMLLKTKYKAMREIYLNKKVKKSNPINGDDALKVVFEIKGQNIELVFMFEKLEEQIKQYFESNKKADNQLIKDEDINWKSMSEAVNPLTGY